MALKLRPKRGVVLSLIFLLGVLPLYSKQENSNYYLGVLAKGYPPGLVAGELRFANAQVVSIKDNMVLFGISEKTKLTTFLKNLPFLQEVYVEAEGIKGDGVLKKNPMAQEFLLLLRRDRFKKPKKSLKKRPDLTSAGVKKSQEGSLSAAEAAPKEKKPVLSGNMAVIDGKLREMVRDTRLKKSEGKQ
jgi:hypothetical protein